MDTITISKKEYRRLLENKRAEGLKEARRFAFSKKAKFVGMWKERKDIAEGVSWVKKAREREDTRSQNL